MSPYVAIVSARFRTLLQYRAAAVAGLWTQVFFGVVLIMIYEGFYLSTDQPQPMTFPEVVSYVWLGQALLALLPWNVDAEIRAMVRSGAVAYELCRPLDLYTLWYMRAMAQRTAPTILRAAPMAILAMFVLPLIGLEEWRLKPPEFADALAFLAALACTLLLACALTTIMNISLMWTVSADGSVALLTMLVMTFSGMIIPLPLFPDWAQPILMALPFAGLVDLPFRIYVGNIEPNAVPAVLLHQVLWTTILVVCGRRLLSRAMRRVVVQGG
jgi:ABC-2 type transport system permease protein